MPSFCVKCGEQLGTGPFCVKCGADTRNAVPTSPESPQPAAQIPAPQIAPVASPVPAKQGMSTLAKLGIAAVVIIFVGGALGAFGLYYVAHRVSQKIHETTDGILGSSSDSSGNTSSRSSDASRSIGDPCRFLSKAEVSKAAGIEVIRADAKDSSCVYIAHGDPAEMVSKHLSAMTSSQVKALGGNVSPQQQQMMQQFAGAFYKQQESADKDLSKEAATGEVAILAVSFTSGNAELEMKMNRMAFNHISQSDGKSTDQTATGDLSGIGDEAYEMGGTGLIMRKGNTVVHMMFPSCPCDANAVKPLLATVASRL